MSSFEEVVKRAVDHTVDVLCLEEEARDLQNWSDEKPGAAADWLRRQLKDQCSDQPN